MKKYLIPFLLSFSCFLLSPAHAQRIALVIGNQDYQVQALRNPINDAQDIAKILKKAHFQVTLKLNASQAEMEQAIIQFGQRLDANTTGLFYYSGHGAQYQGINYLLPVGSIPSIAVSNHLRSKAVSADYILSVMSAAKSPLNIMILDACRNSPFKSFSRDLSRGLARMDKAEGVLIAYATAPGKIALDSGKRNSPYTQQLLQFMQKPGLSIETVLKKTRSAVKKATKQQQTPWYESAIDGEFSFIAGVIKSDTVTLTIRSNLKNDWVKINGIEQGSTRLDKHLNVGRYQVQVGKAGYQTFERWLDLKNNETIMAKLLLKSHLQGDDVVQNDNIPSSKNGKQIKRYIVYNNGIAYDTVTQLTWMRCEVGQHWDGKTCKDKGKKFKWKQAKKQTLNFAGYNDWRIPTIEELRTLVYCSNGKPNYFSMGKDADTSDWGCAGKPNKDYNSPTIVQTVFLNTSTNWVWSSSPYTTNSDNMWGVYFNYGYDGSNNSNNYNRIRLVR